MHRTFAVLFVVLIPKLVQAQTSKKLTLLEASGVSAVTIINSWGYVRVEGWDGDSITAVDSASHSLAWQRVAPGEIRIKSPGDGVGANYFRADIFVRVPRGIRLHVDGSQTKVDVIGVTGRVDVDVNVDGDVSVSGNPSEVNVDARQSDIDLKVSTPYLRAKSASGRIRWTGSSEDVLLSTVTGGITIQAGTVGRGRFETTSGDMRYHGGFTAHASVVFETHSGDITADFPKGTEADLIVSGSITDVLGKHSTGPTDPAQNGATEYQLGKKQDAVVTLRSFKGRVTATVQP
jgi:hypothetical protein